MNSLRTEAKKGFTLIELSIVLVIIGLIVGGILTGRDLIDAAGQRATIAQIEKYNTAVNAFRGKYGSLPGDMLYTSVNAFKLASITLDQGGDSNGLINSTVNGTDPDWFINEPVLFWNELSLSGLIDGNFGTTIQAEGEMPGNITNVPQANAFMPAAKIGNSNSINVASGNGYNYWIISGFGTGSVMGSGTIFGGDGVYGFENGELTPLQSYNMDKKIDDGLPGAGHIWALDLSLVQLTQAYIATPNPPLATCATGTPLTYVTSGANATTPSCSLRIQFY